MGFFAGRFFRALSERVNKSLIRHVPTTKATKHTNPPACSIYSHSQFWNAAPANQSRPEVPRFVFTGSTTNITLRTASSGAAAGWAALTGLKSSSASTRSWGETSMNIERRHRLHSPCPAVRSWTETRIGCAALTVTANRLNGATPPGVAYDSATNGGGDG